MTYDFKKMVTTALMISLGIVLPFAFHSIPNSGGIFLPMHIPILLCGLICGWQYGLVCGIITPLLSSLLTGMPPAAILPGMICELAVYGFVSGLIYKIVHTKKSVADIYIALIGAMIAGRFTYGVLNSLIFKAGKYSLELWVSAAFIKSLPGIAMQLVLIPIIIIALQKAKLIQER